jgi:mannosyl-oligosaccharide glucosidase
LIWKYIDVKQAFNEIKSLLLRQREDGFICLNSKNYIWYDVVKDLTQMPVISWAILELPFNKEFLEFALPRLIKYYEWLKKNRKCGDLFSFKTGGETGSDNSARWNALGFNKNDLETTYSKPLENSLVCVDLSAMMCLFAKNISEIAERIGRLEYLKIARLYKLKAKKIEDKINEFLWCKEDKFYYDRFLNGKFNKVKTPLSCFVLLAKAAPRERARNMVKQIMDPDIFFTPFPVATLEKKHPSFSLDYWRGPVWINTNYVVIKSLINYGYKKEAKIIADKTVKGVYKEFVRTGYLWECYNQLGGSVEEVCHKGRGGVARHFAGWTGLVLNMMLE